MDVSVVKKRSRFLGLAIHFVLLVVGIVLGRYLIIATTDLSSEPVAIEYHIELIQSPPKFDDTDFLALTREDVSDARRKLWESGWRTVGEPTLVSSYGTPINWYAAWQDESPGANAPIVENSVMARSTWANSRVASRIVISQEDDCFSHFVDLARGETRIVRIDDSKRVGGPSIFMLIQTIAIQPNQELSYPVGAPAGGTATPWAVDSFAPGGRSR